MKIHTYTNVGTFSNFKHYSTKNSSKYYMSVEPSTEGHSNSTTVLNQSWVAWQTVFSPTFNLHTPGLNAHSTSSRPGFHARPSHVNRWYARINTINYVN
jgi:hypothetical protein